MSKTYDSVLEMLRDCGQGGVAEELLFAERLRKLSQDDWKDIAELSAILSTNKPCPEAGSEFFEEYYSAIGAIAGILCLGDLPEVSDAEAEEIAKQFQKPTESMGW